MVGKQYAGTKTEKVRVGKIKFQNSKNHYKSKPIPSKLWLRKITQQYSERKEIETGIMALGEDQIFAQQTQE